MAHLVVHSSEEDRELGEQVAATLRAAGHRVERSSTADATASGDPGAPATPAARLHLVLVTRRWSQRGDLGAALESLKGASDSVLLVWWDEDAPSDFLAGGGGARDTLEVFYACFLPVQDRVAALVERLRD